MEQLTLSLEVPPVSHSPSQEEERAWMVNLVSCSSISELYKTFALNGFCGRTSPEFSALEIMRSPSYCKSFQNSGMVLHGQVLMLNSSAWRNGACVCLLSDVLEVGGVPRRFYLTAKACAGILSRAKRKGRNLPEPLKTALETWGCQQPAFKAR